MPRWSSRLAETRQLATQTPTAVPHLPPELLMLIGEALVKLNAKASLATFIRANRQFLNAGLPALLHTMNFETEFETRGKTWSPRKLKRKRERWSAFLEGGLQLDKVCLIKNLSVGYCAEELQFIPLAVLAASFPTLARLRVHISFDIVTDFARRVWDCFGTHSVGRSEMGLVGRAFPMDFDGSRALPPSVRKLNLLYNVSSRSDLEMLNRAPNLEEIESGYDEIYHELLPHLASVSRKLKKIRLFACHLERACAITSLLPKEVTIICAFLIPDVAAFRLALSRLATVQKLEFVCPDAEMLMHMGQLPKGLETLVLSCPRPTMTVAQMHVLRKVFYERPKLKVLCRVGNRYYYEEGAGPPTSAFWEHVLCDEARRELFPGK